MKFRVVLVLLISSLFLISCSSKNSDVSSYNKAAQKHQQDKAEKAYKELN